MISISVRVSLFDDSLFECREYLVGAGDDTAQAAEVLDGQVVVYGQAHVFYHLAGVKLDAEDAFLALCCFLDGLIGEGPQCDGAQDAYLDTLFAAISLALVHIRAIEPNATMR